MSRGALRSALAVLALTTVHHVYGAYVYDTPWRLHAALLSGVAAAVMLPAYTTARRRPHDGVGTLAFWIFAIVTLVVPVLLIGVFEGWYNHVLKVALYFGGAPQAIFDRLFPPPTYERPDDLFFEITGVMQAIGGTIAGRSLYRLLRDRATRFQDRPQPGGAARARA